MRRKTRFVGIFMGDFHLPGAAISVQCWENRGMSKGFKAFIHAVYRKRVLDGYCVEVVVV